MQSLGPMAGAAVSGLSLGGSARDREGPTLAAAGIAPGFDG